MKPISWGFVLVSVGAICSFPASILSAADTITPVGASNSPAASAPAVQAAESKLPYGTEDVLKLTRAQVNEDVIVSYVRNSGIIYNLNPDEISYLRGQGVSDRVINAMVEQGNRVRAAAAQSAALAAASGQNAANPQVPVPTTPPPYIPPQTDYSPTSPAAPYVIPYPQTQDAYYGDPYYYGYNPYAYPYYYGGYPYYYGGYPYYYGGPVIGFGIGVGGYGRYHGGYGGGFHGGVRSGSGFHGSGGFHGGGGHGR